MASRTRSDPYSAPVPPGWPGDDPTVPDDLDVLGHRPRPTRRPPPADRRRDLDPWSARPPVGRRDLDELERDDELVDLDDELDDDLTDADLAHDDLVAGAQPAGRALVIMVAALVLAMLVNADALVDQAERRPPGPARDRALAVWHPVQDISHALQLHRVRQVAEWAVGGDDPDAAPADDPRDARRAPGSRERATGDAVADADDTSEPEDGDGAPVLRTPTADEPLRLWVGGDSMAEVFGRSLADTSGATGVVDPVVHYEMASGLTRPDYYDWPAALADDVAEHDPEVVVVVLGANDGQGIVLDDGTPVQQVSDPQWVAEYRRRVGGLMDDLRDEGRSVVWVGQPPMRDADYGARLAVVNQAFSAEAADRPWVTYVDPAPVLGGPDGAFVETLPGDDGAPVTVRREDGIHLTPEGAELLAAHVLGVVARQVDLTAAPDGAGTDGP